VARRIYALLEVLICSDFPTQLAIGATFNAVGYSAFGPAGHLRVGYVVTLSLLDTVALVGLVLVFLYAHGERPREIFLGGRPIRSEAAWGIPLVLLALALGVGVLTLVQRFVPSLRTVAHNPLQELLRSPRDASLFAFEVVVVGVREEIQRAFLLHRFRVWLGGGVIGLIVTSAAFGAGHALQGADAVITTALLGALWGYIYLRRGSVVAPMVSHAGFDLLQIVQYMTFGR
jgi:membrane protease YdiL (CAAX protease family)